MRNDINFKSRYKKKIAVYEIINITIALKKLKHGIILFVFENGKREEQIIRETHTIHIKHMTSVQKENLKYLINRLYERLNPAYYFLKEG